MDEKKKKTDEPMADLPVESKDADEVKGGQDFHFKAFSWGMVNVRPEGTTQQQP